MPRWIGATLSPGEVVIEPEYEPPPLISAALWYAEQGLPVFPCKPGDKPPLTRHGLKDATTDADHIRRWWERSPQANIGLLTGYRFDVIDIDGYAGQVTRSAMWCDGRQECESASCEHGLFGRIDAAALGKVSTPRDGGMHIYIRAGGSGNGARISRLDGIDFRGIGGYVIAPPSVTPNGRYMWLGEPTL